MGKPNTDPELVFLGYYPKRVYVPERDGVQWTPPVVEICGVSDCISEGASPDAEDAFWTFNQFHCYATPEAAIAAADPVTRDEYEPFAFSLSPWGFDSDGELFRRDLDSLYEEELPPLPTDEPSPSFQPIGFDVAQFEPSMLGWGCSPLSCNGYAGEFEVNRYCLIDEFDAALQLCKLCQETQPEPGDFLVFEVRRLGVAQ